MCGLVSFLSRNTTRTTPDILQKGCQAISHRGPDHCGIWISDDRNIGLGHTRLSIIGVENGNQPLSSHDGNIHAIVNGEFYGYQKIRQDLTQKGYRFKTDSDSEVLVALYQEYGLDCLEFLRGEFAFVLWDEVKKTLFAVRDRFGIKPLCYSIQPDGLYIGSEAKSLFAMGVPAAWDHNAYFHSACLQYTPQDQSLFKDVQQLKPGHVLIARTDDISIKKYWDINYPVQEDAPPSLDTNVINDFHDLLQDCIAERMISDVPVCYHLSGGIDSSAVLGMATALSGKPQDAFTVSFEHNEYDEIEQAQETASMLNANLHVVRTSQKEIISALPDAVYHAEGTAINGHLAAKYLLNKTIQNAGFKVALTGEGADECLAGYPHLRHDLKMGGDDLFQNNTASLGVMMPLGDTLPLDKVEEGLGFIPSFLQAKAGFGHRFHALLNSDFISQKSSDDVFASLMMDIDIENQISGRHPVNRSLYLWTKLALANYILRSIGDGVEMACSIEGRLPFLDHRLFEFTAALPMDYKIRNGVEKYILREAVKPYITDTIYKRQKHPFMAPPMVHFDNVDLNDMINDIIYSQGFKDIPFFDAVKIRHAVSQCHKLSAIDQKAFEPVLMTILTTAILHERFKL